MSPFSCQGQNSCWLSLAFIIYWRFMASNCNSNQTFDPIPGHQQMALPTTKPGGPWPEPEKTRFSALPGAGSTGGRLARAVQGMGHNLLHFWGRPGALWEGQRQKHRRPLQRVGDSRRQRVLAHTLQIRKVSSFQKYTRYHNPAKLGNFPKMHPFHKS